MPLSRYRQTFFWSKVNITDTCWLWTAAVHKNTGYGIFNLAKPMVVSAHRYAYELAYGPIPEGVEVDHRCHVERCVRFDHLKAVTGKQNKENRKGATVASKSGIRGVSMHKASGLWRACATHHGKHFNFGYFSDIRDAEVAERKGRDLIFTNHMTYEQYQAEQEVSQ